MLAACSLVAIGSSCVHAKDVIYSETIPSQGGKIVNPQGVGHPGHPENVERRFARIYQAMDAFRRIHGRLPTPSEVTDFGHPLAPGHQLRPDDFNNPDRQYADHDMAGPEHWQYSFDYSDGKRPDGTRKPVYPKPGEHDVWMDCSHYIRSNSLAFIGKGNWVHYAGFFVVLYRMARSAAFPIHRSCWLGRAPARGA